MFKNGETEVLCACVRAQVRNLPATPTTYAHANMTTSGNLLGIDIGTSNVKAVLVRKSDLQVLAESSKSLGPHLTVPQQHAYERDVQEIFKVKDVGGFVKSPLPQLITWQDGRCTPEFLSTRPPTNQPIHPSTG